MFFEKSRKTWLLIGLAVAAAGFAWYAAGHPMDFRVYHYGARGVFDGTRPVYGPSSGLGWPMHYRYPPLFLLLFAPLAVLPLGVGAGVWVIGKVAVLAGLVWAMIGEHGKIHSPPGSGGELIFSPLVPFLFIAPYLIEEFRYGNAQFFVFALTAVGLLLARKRPMWAGASLALGISIKVWPLFFVPYLAARRDWKVVACAMSFAVLLTLLPSFYFGAQGNLNLLGEWFSQEFKTQLGESEIWFPNQSLRGVLMRYLTVINYSQIPDPNYPQIHFASLDPATVRVIWFAFAAAAYASLLFIAHRRRDSEGWLEHGLAFCLVALLEPFTQKYALSILLWPALVAGYLIDKSASRILIYAAAVLVLVQPVAPGATAQRFMQVLGFDFAATLLLTAAIVNFLGVTPTGQAIVGTRPSRGGLPDA